MWVEKYRPTRLEDLVNQKAIVERISAMLKSPGEMPNLLLAGPPGTGKTTASLIIAKTILADYWRDFTLELNASDERGINTVRNRIKVFARYADRRVEIPFRIIILDEADEMTKDAQSAMRRIMEESSRIARFILIANFSSGIIEPIQSRCAIFRFTRLSEEDVTSNLTKVAKAEKIEYDDEALAAVYDATGGDMRHAINMLQASSVIGKVDMDNVRKTTGLSGKARVGDVIRLALKGSFQESRQKLTELTRVYGMSEHDFIKYANEELFKQDITNPGEAAEILAKYDYRLIVGAHPEIQLSALLAELGAYGKKNILEKD